MSRGVDFRVCNNALKGRNIDPGLVTPERGSYPPAWPGSAGCGRKKGSSIRNRNGRDPYFTRITGLAP